MLAVVLVASSTTAGAATKFVFAQLFLPNACLVVVCLESNANAFIPLVLCHSLLFYKYSLFLYSQHRLLFSGVYAIYSSNTWPRVIFVMSRFCNRVMQYELRIAVFFWPNSYIAPAQCMWPWLARWGKKTKQNKLGWETYGMEIRAPYSRQSFLHFDPNVYKENKNRWFGADFEFLFIHLSIFSPPGWVLILFARSCFVFDARGW